MSAKDMFKNLDLNFVDIKYEDDEIVSIRYSNNNGTWIMMTKDYIENVKNHNCRPLESKYLPAIFQQYKELGWYE